MTYRKRGSVVPDVPRSENTEYMRRYRARSRAQVKRGRVRNRAHGRALLELRRRHPDEFDRLYKKHLKREGVDR